MVRASRTPAFPLRDGGVRGFPFPRTTRKGAWGPLRVPARFGVAGPLRVSRNSGAGGAGSRRRDVPSVPPRGPPPGLPAPPPPPERPLGAGRPVVAARLGRPAVEAPPRSPPRLFDDDVDRPLGLPSSSRLDCARPPWARPLPAVVPRAVPFREPLRPGVVAARRPPSRAELAPRDAPVDRESPDPDVPDLDAPDPGVPDLEAPRPRGWPELPLERRSITRTSRLVGPGRHRGNQHHLRGAHRNTDTRAKTGAGRRTIRPPAPTKNPAATYSPRGLPPKYHRRGRSSLPCSEWDRVFPRRNCHRKSMKLWMSL